MNKVTLIGRLGKDPETRHFEKSQVSSFSLATSKKVKGEESTQWHNISVWGKLSEITEKYLSKGSLVAVSGEIEYRSYEKDGQKIWVTEIKGWEIEMLGGNPSNETKTEPVKVSTDFKEEHRPSNETTTDELPF